MRFDRLEKRREGGRFLLRRTVERDKIRQRKMSEEEHEEKKRGGRSAQGERTREAKEEENSTNHVRLSPTSVLHLLVE